MTALIRKIIPIIGLVLIFAAVFAAYFPSLRHVARGDQVNYMAEVAHLTTWKELAIDTFDLSRRGKFNSGDVLMFRPGFYFFLGNEYYFFKYNFFWCQLIAILMHLFSVTALFLLLRRMGAGVFALIPTLFFALLFSNYEGVVWYHIVSIVSFTAFILMALERLLRYAQGGASAAGALWAAVALTGAALMVNEVALWCAICFFFYASQVKNVSRPWLRASVFCFIAAGYAVWNVFNFVSNGVVLSGEAAKIGHPDILHTFKNVVWLFKVFFAGGFFLHPDSVIPVSRLMVSQNFFHWAWPVEGWKNIYWPGALAGVLLVTGLFLSRRDPKNVSWRPMVILIASALWGYLFFLVIGRVNTRGTSGEGLASALYYHYSFWAFLVAGISAWGVNRIFPKWVLGVMLAVVFAFSVYNAMNIYALAQRMANDHKASRVLFQTLDKVVREHKNEPDFSFGVTPDVPGNYFVSWLEKKGDPPGKRYTLVELMYPKYYNVIHPKYVIKPMMK
ncbi:MAG: hypothetical protein HQL16_05625 [Candidatus Omnitrophica bacterium]|nr:hypothetical protein [Candidatus Omnitrophota bacterium]